MCVSFFLSVLIWVIWSGRCGMCLDVIGGRISSKVVAPPGTRVDREVEVITVPSSSNTREESTRNSSTVDGGTSRGSSGRSVTPKSNGKIRNSKKIAERSPDPLAELSVSAPGFGGRSPGNSPSSGGISSAASGRFFRRGGR